MDRRTFAKLTPLAAASIFTGCAANRTVPGWLPKQMPGEDFRLPILRYAVLAPSAHNAQPWLVDLSRPAEIVLYVDSQRLLPRIDPYARQIHISQGAFLETMVIAARQAGYVPEIKYFPEGEYGVERVETKPVASVALVASPSASRDSLFDSILTRHTNRLPFDRHRPVPDSHWSALKSAPASGTVAWRSVTTSESRLTLAAMLKDAMAIEISNRERNQETAEWFRFSDRELTARRDGFGVAQNGTSGPRKWLAERFLLDRQRAAEPTGLFARSAVSQTAEQAGSAPAFGALITATNSRSDQLLAGRAYARVNLAATRLGLQIQPFSQALQEYSEMADLQKRVKGLLSVEPAHTIQMLFRLGYASATLQPPRRDPTSLIRQSGGQA